MDERRHRLPHLIDAPPRFAIWDADVAAVALSGLVLAILIKVFWIPVLLGLAAGWGYARLKTGKHPSFLTDLAYWYLPAQASARGRVPPSCIREFAQ